MDHHSDRGERTGTVLGARGFLPVDDSRSVLTAFIREMMGTRRGVEHLTEVASGVPPQATRIQPSAILHLYAPPPRKERGMPLTGYGAYERLVFWALLAKAPPPWSVADLDGLEEIITEGFCAEDWPEFAHYEVLDWIRALSPTGREQLILRCNESWETSHQAST
jgi:hypothetical protein